LKGLTKLFNLETELTTWKEVNRSRREMTKISRDEVLQAAAVRELGRAEYRTDQIPIKIVDMSYEKGRLRIERVNLSVPQGLLVSVVGPHGSGKATFLRLVGHMHFPKGGSICVPTHLRILNVTQEPLLMMNLTAWQNLVFGCQGAKDVNPKRVKEILRKLKMNVTLDLVENDLANHVNAHTRSWCAADGGWQGSLSYTETCKMHLARALIMNPEVVVLQRPLHSYDNTTANEILGFIHSHVAERGLDMPQGNSFVHRRPRTCFFSPETVEQAQEADIVWQVSHVGKDTVTVHRAIPEELREDFKRSAEDTPLSSLNPLLLNRTLQENQVQKARSLKDFGTLGTTMKAVGAFKSASSRNLRSNVKSEPGSPQVRQERLQADERLQAEREELQRLRKQLADKDGLLKEAVAKAAREERLKKEAQDKLVVVLHELEELHALPHQMAKM